MTTKDSPEGVRNLLGNTPDEVLDTVIELHDLPPEARTLILQAAKTGPGRQAVITATRGMDAETRAKLGSAFQTIMLSGMHAEAQETAQRVAAIEKHCSEVMSGEATGCRHLVLRENRLLLYITGLIVAAIIVEFVAFHAKHVEAANLEPTRQGGKP